MRVGIGANGIDSDKYPAPRHLISVLGGAVAVAVVWQLVAPPLWIWLLLGSLTVGLVLTGLADLGLRLVRGLPVRRRAAWLPASVTVAGLLAGGVIGGLLPDSGRPPPGCIHPVELRILTSPGNLPTIRELVDAYELWTAQAGAGCPAVTSYVYSVPSDQAVSGLQAGWVGALQEHGPRPDLWLPAAVADVAAVRDGLAGTNSDLVRLDDAVVAASPLVLAVPEDAATEFADHRRLLRWPELPDQAAQFGWQLIRPVPAASEVGELATTALYGQVAPDADPIAVARQTETRIAAALDDGDYPLTGTTALLQRYREHGPAAATTALLVTEQTMVRFNLDRLPERVGDTAGSPATDPLVGFYPTDPVTTDLTVAALTWQDPTSSPGRTAADGLRRWLSGEDGKPALLAAGLRPVTSPLRPGEPTFPLVPELGALPDALPPEQVHHPPPPAAVERAREIYTAAQRPGRVLLAVDSSGSMDQPVGGTGGPGGAPLTRFGVATLAAQAALRQLGDRDEFGIWAFGQPGRRELLALGPATAQLRGQDREEAVTEALGELRPDGPTPLYRTILDGVAAVGGGAGDRVAALVVLTDGEDSEQDPAIIETLAGLDAAGVRVFVVAVGEGSCRAGALVGVTTRTGGACLRAEFDTLTSQLAELFGVLWSGGGDAG